MANWTTRAGLPAAWGWADANCLGRYPGICKILRGCRRAAAAFPMYNLLVAMLQLNLPSRPLLAMLKGLMTLDRTFWWRLCQGECSPVLQSHCPQRPAPRPLSPI